MKKLKDRIRVITRRSRGVKIDVVINDLNRVLRGWIGYFSRSYMQSYLRELMGWVRRRIRQYLWKQWKNKDNRRRRLRQLGVPETILRRWKLGSNSYWRMAGASSSLITNEIIHNRYKLVDAVLYYKNLHRKRMEMDLVVLDYRYNCLFS